MVRDTLDEELTDTSTPAGKSEPSVDDLDKAQFRVSLSQAPNSPVVSTLVLKYGPVPAKLTAATRTVYSVAGISRETVASRAPLLIFTIFSTVPLFVTCIYSISYYLSITVSMHKALLPNEP